MGVERSVTRWYALRQSILHEIELLEEKRGQTSSPSEESSAVSAELEQALVQAQAKLKALGPCPKPMMG